MNYMRHDKKSLRGEINLTMVRTPGEYEINCSADEKEVAAALDIFRDLLGF
jgi:3-dehydroquinate synthetase